MGKVFSAHAVSVDGYITGRDPGPGRGLGDGSMLFDWYLDGTTPSQVFDGFPLSEPSARIFDAPAGRVGAVVAGRNTYEDSDHFGGGSPHPTARLFVLSHRPAPEITERQTLVTTGITDAIAAAREAAGDTGRRSHGRRRRHRGVAGRPRRRTDSPSSASPARRRPTLLPSSARARAFPPRRSRPGARGHPPPLRGRTMILITGGLHSIGSHTARDETSTALATRIEEAS
jgi:dihydrofolate reductase